MKIISISSISAGGATTITNEIARQLEKAKVLAFDQYRSSNGPSNIHTWIENGAHYSEWNIDAFVQAVKQAQSESYQYLLLDYPFGYKHPGLRSLIDYSVFIDTPVDICLVRLLQRDYQNQSTQQIQEFLTHYQNDLRYAYIQLEQDLIQSCDLKLNGLRPMDKLIHDLKTTLQSL